ncbi:hypothetical protein Bbelb_104560 [Branchiostoma belcheri]|nr:hypothetical protein Bbelb_104560 [Branchiostoma belcheri]
MKSGTITQTSPREVVSGSQLRASWLVRDNGAHEVQNVRASRHRNRHHPTEKTDTRCLIEARPLPSARRHDRTNDRRSEKVTPPRSFLRGDEKSIRLYFIGHGSLQRTTTKPQDSARTTTKGVLVEIRNSSSLICKVAAAPRACEAGKARRVVAPSAGGDAELDPAVNIRQIIKPDMGITSDSAGNWSEGSITDVLFDWMVEQRSGHTETVLLHMILELCHGPTKGKADKNRAHDKECHNFPQQPLLGEYHGRTQQLSAAERLK